MTLASFTDANQWLDGTKVSFADANDLATGGEATQADSIIRSTLRSLFPDHVSGWDNSGTPEATPRLIRTIASLLYASYRYAKLYSEEVLGPSDYAQRLETRAMTLLQGIQSGDLQLDDELYQSASVPTRDFFYPNDQTVIDNSQLQPGFNDMDPDRKFGVDKVF